MQIGASIAGQRAAAQFRAQAQAREAQEQAVKDAQWQAEFQLTQQEHQERAQQAAAKLNAMKQYQSAIAGGMDPVQAMLQYGPAMGQQGSPEAAAFRSAQMQKKPVPQLQTQDVGGGAQALMYNGQMHVLRPPTPPKPVGQWLPVTKRDAGGNEYEVQQNTLSGLQRPGIAGPKMSEADRIELSEANAEMRQASAALTKREVQDNEEAKQEQIAKLREAKKTRDEILKKYPAEAAGGGNGQGQGAAAPTVKRFKYDPSTGTIPGLTPPAAQ